MVRKYHKDGTLPQNGEVWVFGSNLAGIHGAGAAKIAVQKFGALYGCGLGWRTKSYAIPTKDEKMKVIPLDKIKEYVNMFSNATFTTQRILQDYETAFFVTRVGCGLAGYTDAQIAPMFKDAINCSFAEQWKPYLEN